VTELQEQKLDKVLELTARHGAHLGMLSAQYQRFADKQDVLETKVTTLEAHSQAAGRKVPIRIAIVAAIVSAYSAVVSTLK
jgi:hypothetical protein